MAEGDTEQVIELSIEETNRLRAELGLKPLTGIASSTTTDSTITAQGRKPSEAIHVPAANTGNELAVNKRLEESKLRREVEAGLLKLKSEQSLDHNTTNNLDIGSWTSQMRRPTKSNPSPVMIRTQDDAKDYTLDEMMKQNITVAHSTSAALELGSSTILTLADRSLILHEDTEEHELENIHFAQRKIIEDNLREKRLFGSGYRGIDDDEFDESEPMNRMILGSGKMGASGSDTTTTTQKKKMKFNDLIQKMDTDSSTDLFASEKGLAISLQSSWNPQAQQSDFMTTEEEVEEYGPIIAHNVTKKRMKLSKKDRKTKSHPGLKDDKKMQSDPKEDPQQQVQMQQDKEMSSISESDLIKDLEEHSNRNQQRMKRRRRPADDEESDEEKEQDKTEDTTASTTTTGTLFKNTNDDDKVVTSDAEMKTTLKPIEIQKKGSRLDKYRRVMEKGNARSDAAFNKLKNKPSHEVEPLENDDALEKSVSEKSSRLARLKALNQQQQQQANVSLELKGAAAIAFTVKSLDEKLINDPNAVNEPKKITFQLDSTRDFALSLQSKSQPAFEVAKVESTASTEDMVLSSTTKNHIDEIATMETVDDSDVESMTESTADLDNTMFGEAPMTVGRGLASVIGLLKQTGEITGKNAGREEMKGRAKDIKTYEDYEKLDLKDVVKIDKSISSGGGPHEKDIEYANREIKLDYRDEHGRLLTRKEAYRNLCYQFHGYGSGKKNQERRLKQIERERLDKVSDNKSTLDALKATQKATGKAFIVHKT